LYEDGIRAADIHQGKLGDCYFLAAVAAVAERDAAIIERALSNPKPGVFAVQWYPNGVPLTTYVDDRFVHAASDGKLAFSHSGSELWVNVLEKALAKEYGSYKAIGEGGNPCDALSTLTGKPSTSHSIGWGAENVFQLLADSKMDHKVICASVNPFGVLTSPLVRTLTFGLLDAAVCFVEGALLLLLAGSRHVRLQWLVELLLICLLLPVRYGWRLICLVDSVLLCGAFSTLHVLLCSYFTGLVPGHAYSVLEIKEEQCCCGCATRRFVKLRNPWGELQCKAWGLSTCTCCFSRPPLPLTETSKGEYWLTLEDFRLFFDQVHILHLQGGWAESRVAGSLSGRTGTIAFSLSEACKVRVALFDRDRRASGFSMQVKEEGGNAALFPVGWTWNVVKGGPFTHLIGGASGFQQATDEMECQPGRKYLVDIACVPFPTADPLHTQLAACPSNPSPLFFVHQATVPRRAFHTSS
jgi:hypothetical protein